jgi:HEPN domain-containing protein
MTQEEHIRYWIDSADDDLESAEANFNCKRYNWCLFIGHLVLEKALKALYVQTHNATPPKIHDLIKLSTLSNILIEDDVKKLFYIMNKFQLETRYPDYKQKMFKIATLEMTTEYFAKTKEVYQWLKSRITL